MSAVGREQVVEGRRWQAYVPGIDLVRNYRRAWLGRDVVAGLVLFAIAVAGIAVAPSMAVVLGFAAVSGAGLPLIIIGYLTLLQRRTPQAIMGRVSTAIEVVMATPQAVSLALGSALVLVLTYRQIYAIMGVVTLLAAAHIAFWLRRQIRDDLRGGGSGGPGLRHEPDIGSPVSAALPTLD